MVIGDSRADDISEDPDLPLARRLAHHRYSPRELIALDAATVAVFLIVFELVLSRQVARVSGTGWDLATAVGYFLASAGVLLRRRFPQVALLLISVIAVFSQCLRAQGPTVFYLVLALYSFVVVTTRRRALLVVALVGSGVLAASIVGGGAQIVPISIGGVALMGIGWLAGENTRASRNYTATRQDRVAERAAAVEHERAEQLRQAVSDERAKIARELHDIVAHAMSVIAIRSGVARMVIDTEPEEAREALAIIETTTRRSLQEMRLLVGVLRSGDDQSTGLQPAPGLVDLDRLVADVSVLDVHVDVEVDGVVRGLPPAVDLSAYRIVQEALTNVVRHAGPTRARVRIAFRPEQVVIEIDDEGPTGPIPPSSFPQLNSGHGLIGMRERAALFGGELSAGRSGPGFRVTANLHTGEHDRGAPTVHDAYGPSPGNGPSIAIGAHPVAASPSSNPPQGRGA
jgi:signal transduction histidine kinase